MGHTEAPAPSRGKWMALIAALLGWMFDGFEMGIFPLVANPGLQDLLGLTDAMAKEPPHKDLIGKWIGVITAVFLVGAATGGVLFGWLGDRIGRVRAMTLSVLAYALFTGLCGLASSVTQLAVFRFLASLGMGGEWSLGVALVMEIWPNRSRGWLAGVIGAASNFGFFLVALIGLWLATLLQDVESGLRAVGLSEDAIGWLMRNRGWRLLMFVGALPAILTFFIRLVVPESHRWQEEKGSGATSNWATRDLFGVLIGAASACGMIALWAFDLSLWIRIPGSLIALVITTLGFIYPVFRYLQRSTERTPSQANAGTLSRMFLGAGLSGVALLATWASVQWVVPWTKELTKDDPNLAGAGFYVQICSALAACVGTIAAAVLGERFGRRIAYIAICLTALISALGLYQLNTQFNWLFLVWATALGFFSAAFYGWLPLYLPELFPTRVRAIGQGFAFNFGRIIAAVGALQTGYLISLFPGGFPTVGSVMSVIYLLGVGLIWLAPETKGKPLPE